MRIKSFLKLVEIQTKVASVVPFFLGLAYVYYNFGKFNLINSLVMFFGMIIFDMTVTALNNYFDFKRAVKKDGYNYEVHNSIVQFGLKEAVVLFTIIFMLIVAVALGLYLVYLTDYIVLLLGVVCFGVGIIYSYGPLPVSRTPLGEIFSGVTMGLLIPFITVYINAADAGIVELSLNKFVLSGSIDLWIVLGLIIACAPPVFGIANIMLANNTCDIEDDVANKRFTLAVLIGRPKSIVLLKVLFYASYAAIVAGVAMRVLPLVSLLVLITMIPVSKHIKAFAANPTKKDTFGLIVLCFLLINVALVLSIGAGILINVFI